MMGAASQRLRRIGRKIIRERLRAKWRLSVKTVSTSYLGMPLKVPVMAGMERKLIVPDEMLMSHCMNLILKWKEGAVLDVGANSGVYLVKLRCLGHANPYYGFDANPLCAHFVSELIRINNFQNSYVFAMGLAESRKTALLYWSKPGDPSASTHPDMNKGGGVHSSMIYLEKGDDICGLLGLTSVALLKVDVEGAEREVLEGFSNTLRNRRPVGYCEILRPDECADADQQAKRVSELFDFLEGVKYRVMGMAKTLKPTVVAGVQDLGGHYTSEYLLVPEEDLEMCLSLFAQYPFVPSGLERA